jgi:hypothetical protein
MARFQRTLTEAFGEELGPSDVEGPGGRDAADSSGRGRPLRDPPAAWVALRQREARVLQLEPEIADAREHSVELRLVSDLADELGPTAVAYKRHSLKGRREAIAEPAAHNNSDPGRSHRASPPSALHA